MRIRLSSFDIKLQLERAMLSRADVTPTDGMIHLFYPNITEQKLASLERDYLEKHHPGKKVSDILATTFRANAAGEKWSFYVAFMKMLPAK